MSLISILSKKKIWLVSLFFLSFIVLILVWCGKNEDEYLIDLWEVTTTGSNQSWEILWWISWEVTDVDIFDDFVSWDIETLDTTMTQYKNYENELLTSLLSENSQILLFFYSENDPSSRALDKDIRKTYWSLPENTIILKIDKETQSDVYDTYEISQPNIILFLDNDGSISRQMWLGVTNLSMILKRL